MGPDDDGLDGLAFEQLEDEERRAIVSAPEVEEAIDKRSSMSAVPPETRKGRGAIKACSSTRSCPPSTRVL